jgi:hypothetical protein
MNRRRRRTFRNILDRSPYSSEDDAARSQERLEINDAEQRT